MVFSLTRRGFEKVLYSFQGGSDGANPRASLIEVNGTLYGTTSAGGSTTNVGCGTVFSLTPPAMPGGSWTEAVLHAFTGGLDGCHPYAGLIDVSGTLYGTTEIGGALDQGTVFSITPSGTEKVLYPFKGASDGTSPYAGLIDDKGRLYGTTTNFGSHGGGTMFSLTLSGTETPHYSFMGGNDGGLPYAGLTNVNGTLYGTTEYGGGTGCFSSGCGTVFSISRSGTEKVLYAFQSGSDGSAPMAGLINVKGTLYGTTANGGGGGGGGTVFSITTGGTEKVLYAFGSGYFPESGLVAYKGTLYGATYGGGSGTCSGGCGTVFAVTP